MARATRAQLQAERDELHDALHRLRDELLAARLPIPATQGAVAPCCLAACSTSASPCVLAVQGDALSFICPLVIQPFVQEPSIMVKKITTVSPKSAAKPSVVTPVTAIKPEPVASPEVTAEALEEQSVESLWARMQAANAKFLEAVGTPGWARTACAWLLGALVAIGFGWLVGLAVNLLMIGILTLTGSAFLAMLVYMAGLVIGFVGGGWYGTKAYGMVTTGEIEQKAKDGWSAVKGFFGPKAKAVAAPVAAAA